MIKIKLCGITTLEDGLAAIAAGADMLGFNFYRPSPRYVEPKQCASILSGLRANGAPFTAVGVFVNTPRPTVATILDECGLDLAQLHGDEPPDDLLALGDRAYKAIRPVDLEGARTAMKRYRPRSIPPVCLLDTPSRSAYGGTGRVSNWQLAATLARENPLLLAGGLNPENVRDAVAQVRPWGVDVASGIESSPGRKDPAKMAAFVLAVRTANDQISFANPAKTEP